MKSKPTAFSAEASSYTKPGVVTAPTRVMTLAVPLTLFEKRISLPLEEKYPELVEV
jgi:hypothetical protein